MMSFGTKMVGASLNLKLFWGASLISSIAMGVYLVAFNWLTVKNYGAYGISMITIAFAIPQTLLVLFGGLASDFINKQTLFRVSQGLYCILGIATFVSCINEAPPLWFLMLLNFASGLIIAFYSPNRTSLISSLVPESQITSTQQTFYFATGLGWVIGSVLASHLLSFRDEYLNNTHGALAFLFYVLAMIPAIFCTPKVMDTKATLIPGASIGTKMKTALQDIRSSLLYLRTTVDIRVLMRMLAIVLVLGMPFTYLLSIYAHAHPTSEHSSKFFSHLYAALSAGNLIGALVGILITKSTFKQATLLLYMIFGLCISAIAALLLTQIWEMILMVLLAGLFTSLSTNLLKGLTQSQSRQDMRGRIAGFTQLLAGLSNISAGLAGFVIHHLTNQETSLYSSYEIVQMILLGLLAILTLLSMPSILKSRITI